MSEDKKIQNLIINKLTKEQYKSLEEKAIDELYFVTDEEHFTAEEINELLAVKQDKLTAGDGIEILEDGTINNTRVSAEWGNIQGDLSAQTDLQELVSTKVDKQEGKSLISDTEIERLANVDNYDDTLVLSNINDLKINKQDKLTAGTGIEISEDNVISATGTQGGSSTWGSIDGDIKSQEDLQDELNTRGSKIEYTGSTLSLLNSNDEVLNSVNITSGGTGSVNIDNKTISYNENNEIQSVGNYTLNNEFKNYWSGTLEEYNRDLKSGLITENTECNIIDDEEIIFDTLLTATTNSKGVVQPDGKTITIDENGIISSIGGGTATEVDIATVDKAGIVKPDGETISIDDNGTISANIPDVDTSNLANIDLSNITDLGLQNVLSTLANVAKTGSYNDLTDKPTIPNEYTLPTASTDVLGGVKVDGTTISILDGVISAVTQGGDEWEYSLGTNSYIKHKTSGLMIQRGKFTTIGGKASIITFPKAFTSIDITISFHNTMQGSFTPHTITTTNFSSGGSYTTGGVEIFWLAFGY